MSVSLAVSLQVYHHTWRFHVGSQGLNSGPQAYDQALYRLGYESGLAEMSEAEK